MQVRLLTLAAAVAASFASVADAADYYHEGMGTSIVKTENEHGENDRERVLGGWNVEASNLTEAMKAPFDGDVTIGGGRWNYVIGGNYVKAEGDYRYGTHRTVIEGTDTDVYHVIGGTGASNASGASVVGKKTELVIRDGHFGSKALETNVLEQMVVAGDLLKSGANHTATTSELKEAGLTVSGGTFDAVVIGGSVAYGYYESPSEISASVERVRMDITGGTFNEPIVAGGMAGGHNGSTQVGESELHISGESGNLTLNNHIYLGSLYSNTQSKTSASVGQVTLTVEHAAVKGIYAADVEARMRDSEHTTEGNHWVYTKFASKNETPTETHATLTNVTAEAVEIGKGSLTFGVVGNGLTSVDALSLGDAVAVAAFADGETNDALKGDIGGFLEKNLRIGGDGLNGKDMTVRLEAGEAVGEVTGEVIDGVLDPTTVVEKPNQKNVDITRMAGMLPQMIARIEMNDLRKRMGDLRSGTAANGVWARYDGGKLRGEGLENDFHKIQVGVDTIPTADAPRFGLAFSYTQGDVDGDAATADTNTYSLAAYGVWFGDGGQFADVVARLATIDTEIDTVLYRTGFDQTAVSLSGEFGWRLDVTENLFVEPSVEATYTYVGDETFRGNRSRFELEAYDTLTARAGAALGMTLPEKRGDLYVRAGVAHEFLGESRLSIDDGLRTVESDGKDTWFEYAVGGNFRLTDSTYVYADLERSAGNRLDVDWRANLGIRYAW